MVTRKLLTVAAAVGLSVSLLAQQATGAEALPVEKAPLAADFVVDAQTFRREIDGHVRAHNAQMRTKLNQDLRRELGLNKVVLASNELRTRI